VLSVGSPQHCEFAQVAKWQRMQEHARHHAENGGIGADTEGQGENQAGAQRGMPDEQAQSESQILQKSVHCRISTAILASVSTLSPVAFWPCCGTAGRSTSARERTRPVNSRSLTTLARSRSICESILWMKVRLASENSMPVSWVAATSHTGLP